ncbi:hypothetical protein CRG98_013356, partial [Punica granatum]
MASSPFTSMLKSPSPSLNSPFCPKLLSQFPSSPLLSFSHTLRPFRSQAKSGLHRKCATTYSALT